MANNQYVNKVIFGDGSILDLTQDTVEAGKMFIGEIAHDKSGATITGTYNPYPTIAVTTPPTTTSYDIGDTLDLSGMVVTATLPSGFTKNITNECTYSPANGATLTASDTSVTVSYTYLGETFTTSQSLDVTRITEIYVATPPTKTSYLPHDNLDLTGMVVKAKWSNGNEDDITSQITTVPANGADVNSSHSVSISWTWSATGQTFTTTQSITIIQIVTWADGTDEEIADMLELHYNNVIDITNYWSVGDTRTVSLSAMEATGVGESHGAQNVTFVLMNKGGKALTTSINGHTECAFIVGMKDSLAETGYMRPQRTFTNADSWSNCERRTWCNDTFRNAIPSTLRDIFKQHKNTQANGCGPISTTETTDDYFALPAEKEIWGGNSWASSRAETSLKQFSYYGTAINRRKRYGNSGSTNDWWERSITREYDRGWNCFIGYDGARSYDRPWYFKGISPFGVI